MNKELIKNKYLESHLNNLAYKKFINGFYGAQGNNYFKYFNLECAKSVTAGGRLAIKAVDKYLEKLGYKVNYIDTDSVFIRLGDYLEEKNKDFYKKTKDEQFKIIQKEIERIEKIIKKIINEVLTSLNTKNQTVEMEFELLSDYTLFLNVKKKYIIKKYFDDSGKFYEGKSLSDLKMRNIDLIKSSTPEKIKVLLEKFILNLMNKNQDEAYKMYKNIKKTILNEFDLLDLAIARKINTDLSKYKIIFKNNIVTFQKGTPLHIRGVLIHNFLIDKYKLPLEKIKTNDLIKFVYVDVKSKKVLKYFNFDEIYVIAWKDDAFLKEFDFKVNAKKILNLIETEIKSFYEVIKTDKNPYKVKKLDATGLFG